MAVRRHASRTPAADIAMSLAAPGVASGRRTPAPPTTPPPSPPPQWSPVSSLRRVLSLVRPVRWRFVGAAALGSAAEVCTIGLAGAAAWLIVRASEQPELAALSVAILGVRAFGTGKGVFRYAERLATHDTGLRSLSEIRSAVVARLAEIAPAGVPGWQRGDLLQRMVADVDRLLDLFVRVLGPIVAVGLTASAHSSSTLLLDGPAGLVLLAALVIVGVAVPTITVVAESTIGRALGDRRRPSAAGYWRRRRGWTSCGRTGRSARPAGPSTGRPRHRPTRATSIPRARCSRAQSSPPHRC